MSKKANRSKFKTASSGAAAALVTGAEGGVLGFVGFGSPAGEDDLGLLALSPELRALLRGLQKKDAVTKSKTLSELCTLVKESDEEGLKQILESYAKPFARLAIDDSFKVRERSMEVLRILGPKAGRKLEKYLASYLPNWFLARHDPYPEVRSMANNGLEATFSSPDKRKKAISLFLPQIISLCRTLVLEPAKLLPSPVSGESPEEKTSREERVRRSGLGALAQLAQLTNGPVTPQQLATALGEDLLSSQQLWALAQPSSSLGVREACLSTLRAWVSSLDPEAMAPGCGVWLPPVMAGLREVEYPSLLSPAWDTILLLVSKPHFHSILSGKWSKKIEGVMREVVSRSLSEEASRVVCPALAPVLRFACGEDALATATGVLDAFQKGLEKNEWGSFRSGYSDCVQTSAFHLFPILPEPQEFLRRYGTSSASFGAGISALCGLWASIGFQGRDLASALVLDQLALLGTKTETKTELGTETETGTEGTSVATIAAVESRLGVLGKELEVPAAAATERLLATGGTDALLNLWSTLATPATTLRQLAPKTSVELAAEGAIGDAPAFLPILFALAPNLATALDVLKPVADTLGSNRRLVMGQMELNWGTEPAETRRLWDLHSPWILGSLVPAVIFKQGSLDLLKAFLALVKCRHNESHLVDEASCRGILTGLSEQLWSTADQKTAEHSQCALALTLDAFFATFPPLSGSRDGLILAGQSLLDGHLLPSPSAQLQSSALSLLHRRVLEGGQTLEDDVLPRIASLEGEESAAMPEPGIWLTLLGSWRPNLSAGLWKGGPACLLLDPELVSKLGAEDKMEVEEKTVAGFIYGLRLLAAFPSAMPEAGSLMAAVFALSYSLRLNHCLDKRLNEALEVVTLTDTALSEMLGSWASLGQEEEREELVIAAVLEALRQRPSCFKGAQLKDETLAKLSPRLQILLRLVTGTRRRILPAAEDWSSREWELLGEWSTIGDVEAEEAGQGPIAAWITAVAHDPEQQELLLHCSDLNRASGTRLLINAALVQHLTSLVAHLDQLPSGHKDFLLCSLLAWLQVRRS